jgi:glycosyltransferase involved in cell wall biosynthesis
LPLSKKSLKKHLRLENSVFQQADQLVVVSKDMQFQMEKLAFRKPELISNGYAPEDFQDFKIQADPHFTILHTGSINKDRNPSELWKSLGIYVKNNTEFALKLRIRLIGALDSSVKDDIENAGLLPFTHFESFVPHDRVVKELASCSLLILPLNNVKSQKGIVTGKLFEYLASQQSILAIGPKDGDAAGILNTQAGTKVIGFDEPIDWDEIIKLSQENSTRTTSLLPYSRRALAASYAALVSKVINRI